MNEIIDRVQKRGRGRPPKAPGKTTPVSSAHTIKETGELRGYKKWAGKVKAGHWDDNLSANDIDAANMLGIPRDEFPEEMDLKWVTETVYGQPFPQRLADAEKNHWVVVHGDDFDGMYRGRFASNDDSGPIRKDGLVLVTRPQYISDGAKQKEDREAKNPVMIKERALRGGDFGGVTLDTQHKTALNYNKINRTIEKIEIPNE